MGVGMAAYFVVAVNYTTLILSVIGLVLGIRVLLLAIKALQIYIDKNS